MVNHIDMAIYHTTHPLKALATERIYFSPKARRLCLVRGGGVRGGPGLLRGAIQLRPETRRLVLRTLELLGCAVADSLREAERERKRGLSSTTPFSHKYPHAIIPGGQAPHLAVPFSSGPSHLLRGPRPQHGSESAIGVGSQEENCGTVLSTLQPCPPHLVRWLRKVMLGRLD